MKQYITLLILSVALSACAKIPEVRAPLTGINAELAPYKTQFYEAARSVGFNTSALDRVALGMEFTDKYDSTPTLGTCQRYTGSNPAGQILINRKDWDAATSLDKKTVMFHELAHCLLNRGHLDIKIIANLYSYDRVNNRYVNPVMYRIPGSIMNTYQLTAYLPSNGKFYFENELFPKYYMEELFLNKEYEEVSMKLATSDDDSEEDTSVTHTMNADGSCNHH